MYRKIILASQSKQRLNILRTLALPIDVMPSNINEQAVPFTDQYDKAEKIALAKAKKIALNQPDAIIIAADTFCYFKDRILEKPKSLEEAKDMLRFQSGQKIEVLTGYAFLDTKLNLQKSGCERISVQMRKLSPAEIERYVANEPVLTWSAAFSPAYDSGMALIDSIDGNLTAFSHGLPINLLVDFLGVNYENNH
jgi:septum formation protein